MLLAASIAVLLHLVAADSSGEGPDWSGGRLPPFFPNGKDRPIPRYAPTFSRHTPFMTEESLPSPVFGRFGGGPQRGFIPGGDRDSGSAERSGPPRFAEKREFSEPFSGPQGETENRPSEFLPPRFGATGRVPGPEYFQEKEGPPRGGGGDRAGFPELGKPYYPEYFRPDGSDGPVEGFRPRIKDGPGSDGPPEGYRPRIKDGPGSDGPPEGYRPRIKDGNDGPPEGYRPRGNVPDSHSAEEGPRQRYSGSGEAEVAPTRPRYRAEVPDEGPRGFRPPPEIYRPRYSEGEGFPEGSRNVSPPPGYRPQESSESRNQPFRGPGPASNPARNPDLDERRPPSPQPPQYQGQGPQSRPVRPPNPSNQAPQNPENSRSTPPHGGDIELPGDKSRPDRLFAIRPPEFPPIPAPPPYPSLSPKVIPATPPPLPGAYHFGTTAPPEKQPEARSNQTQNEAGKPPIPVYSPLSGPFPAQNRPNSEGPTPTSASAPAPQSSQASQEPPTRQEPPRQEPSPQQQQQQQQQRQPSEGQSEPPKQKPQGLPPSFRSFFPPGFGPFEKGAGEAKTNQ
uniref:Enamelin n=1 Tax=Panagrellus redivivus TaxID=6233 RepID=A0A7E4VMZ4_PANRE